MNVRPDPKEVERACVTALSNLGATVKYSTLMLPLDSNYFGWIGLNRGVHDDFVRINPNIGVHCTPVERLIALARKEKYQKGRFPTVSDPLGLICPHVLEFIFVSSTDLAPEADRLAATIRDYGLPHLQGLTNYDSLLTQLKERISSFGGAPERYSTALFLSGDKEGALHFLDEKIKELLGRDSSYSSIIESLQLLETFIEEEGEAYLVSLK